MAGLTTPRARHDRTTRSPNILIVDDTPADAALLAGILEVRGYAAVTSASGAEALKRLEEEPFDIVLLDVRIPGMSGYEVCRTIIPFHVPRSWETIRHTGCPLCRSLLEGRMVWS